MLLTSDDLKLLIELVDRNIQPSAWSNQEELQGVVNKMHKTIDAMQQGTLVLTPKRTYTNGADGAVKRARKLIRFERDADACIAVIGDLTLNYFDVFEDEMVLVEHHSEGTLRYMFRKIVLVSVALWEYRKGLTVTHKLQLSSPARDLIIAHPKINAVKAVSYLRRKLDNQHLEE